MARQASTAESEVVRSLIGGIAGVVATGPMTVAMILLHRLLPGHERYPLPPRQIAMKAARELGVLEAMPPASRYAATLITHFGYGAGVGALYGALEENLPVPPAAKGILYGLLVWAGSYLGILPVAGALTSAASHPIRRTALMIAVHAIWGLALGLLMHVFAQEAGTGGRQPFSAGGSHVRDVPE
jgi:putative membrane protein